MLSGLFVLVLAPHTSLLAVAVSSGLAVVGTRLSRTQAVNIFNPAALALAGSALLLFEVVIERPSDGPSCLNACVQRALTGEVGVGA